jgi:CRISPR/Cas system-associated exonuclease Cas4 (RecB family)
MTQNRSLISTRRCTVATSASVSNLKCQRDVGEADRRLAVDAGRAARIPMALSGHPPAPKLHAHRCGDCAYRYAGTGNQRLQ